MTYSENSCPTTCVTPQHCLLPGKIHPSVATPSLLHSLFPPITIQVPALGEAVHLRLLSLNTVRHLTVILAFRTKTGIANHGCMSYCLWSHALIYCIPAQRTNMSIRVRLTFKVIRFQWRIRREIMYCFTHLREFNLRIQRPSSSYSSSYVSPINASRFPISAIRCVKYVLVPYISTNSICHWNRLNS